MSYRQLSTAVLCVALALMVACKGKPSDAQIQAKVTEQLSTLPNVTAEVKDGVVTLSGEVPDEAARAEAEQKAATDGVKSITNNIVVAAPAAATPPAPVTDTASIVNAADQELRNGVTDITKDFPGVDVKVVNGVVSVTGELTAAKWKTLKQALDGLHPKKVDASGLKVK
jgi:hyperosmotically inducible protein